MSTKHIQLYESFQNDNKIFYHGSVTEFPFQKFEKRMDGAGIVSNGGTRYGGFFFTDNKDNAEFYTEWFVCQVQIKNLKECSPHEKHPSAVLKKGIEEKCNYLISDVLDGHAFSDIAVVPHSNLDDIIILNWEFIGDEESYFERLDKMFTLDDDDDDRYDDEGNYIAVELTQEIINDTISMTGGGLDYLLAIPVFKKYYDSKNEY
jgi:hypothetical protein